jgi:type IV pilus assembly protein PilE
VKNALAPSRPPRGYTLIELVVTVLIAAVLVAIAVPSYMNYSLQSHRTDAKTALLDLASLEERYYTTANAYTNVPTNVGYSGATWPAAGISVGSNYYLILPPVVTAATAPTANTSGSPATYTLTAVPTGTQVKDTACAQFIVTSSGSRTATNSGGSDNTAACWN